jgi:hypothetical protein
MAAQGCVSAIKKGLDLYKQIKGTVQEAQKTFTEVKKVTKEVGGFFGLFTKTVEVEVEVAVEQPKGKKSQPVVNENTVYAELATNLGKLFTLQDQLKSVLREEEAKSKSVYDPSQNVMAQALNRVMIQEQMDRLSEEIHWAMIYESPKELGALYSKCHHMRMEIEAEQDYARGKIEKKKREAKRKKEEMVSKMQDNVIYFVAVFFVFSALAFIWWVIVMDRKASYGW